MKKRNAKHCGYKVIDEFGSDISSIVFVEVVNGKFVVYDEFDSNVTSIVKVEIA